MNYRVGCVPYLNAYPLTAKLPPSVEVILDVPSALPARLASGEVSAILVSSIESLRMPGAVIADGASISSQNQVLSVRLFSKVPLTEIKSLALDQSSMTSNTLVQILLADMFDVRPACTPMPPNLDKMLAEHDAGLLIGDIGMRTASTVPHILDLGQAWRDLTNMPFVWAVWLGKADFPTELAKILAEARREATSDITSHIVRAAEKFGFSPDDTAHYLGKIMDYEFGSEHQLALAEFGSRAQSLGLLGNYQMPTVLGGGHLAALTDR